MIKYKIFLLVFLMQFYSHSQKTNTIKEIPAINFQTQVDGKTTNLYTLKNKNGMTAQITNYGARVVSLWVPDRKGDFQDVVWGFETIAEYLASSDIYCGPIVGRFGNRIDKGRFELNGTQFQVTINNNENHLHGGTKGFYAKVWDANSVKIEGNEALELTYFSKDGEEGYPGNLTIKVTYMLTEDNSLKLLYSATTDKTTIINPTSHCYFNLSGTSKNTILEHVLFINAQKFTPTNEGLIPTGELRNLKDTPLDFNIPTAIGDKIDSKYEQLLFGKGYDHNFVLNEGSEKIKLAAVVTEENSGRKMEVFTTQPGIQFYSGNFLDGAEKAHGTAYQFRTGFCLETQHFPNSPNQPSFPSTLLKPGEKFESQTIYKFSILK